MQQAIVIYTRSELLRVKINIFIRGAKKDNDTFRVRRTAGDLSRLDGLTVNRGTLDPFEEWLVDEDAGDGGGGTTIETIEPVLCMVVIIQGGLCDLL